jgi:histone acetyltransferase (RNA polymerase elongator complex component)
MMDNNFEMGPIRPPSEAQSLLIRVTRNCPWNHCTFCHTYKGELFSFRPVEDIKKDIDRVKAITQEIQQLSWRMGCAGEFHPQVLKAIYAQGESYGPALQTVAGWLYFGGKQAFLQDANSLMVKTKDLVEILQYLKNSLPSVERITTYARAKTAAQKSVAELQDLHRAGLSRIHIGMETGYDPLLQYIKKGVTAREQVEAGRNIVASGISLSEYVMPGLGGKRWWREHAVETAKVLNQIDPDFIRLRSLYVRKNMPLSEQVATGDFVRLTDDEVVGEIRLFLSTLEGIHSTLVSDHILNLLEEVQGKLPEDKEKMIAVLDRYLALPEEDRLHFRLGRRMGYFRKLEDLEDADIRRHLRRVIEEAQQAEDGEETRSPRDVEQAIYRLMENYI